MSIVQPQLVNTITFLEKINNLLKVQKDIFFTQVPFNFFCKKMQKMKKTISTALWRSSGGHH